MHSGSRGSAAQHVVACRAARCLSSCAAAELHVSVLLCSVAVEGWCGPYYSPLPILVVVCYTFDTVLRRQATGCAEEAPMVMLALLVVHCC